MSEHRLIELHAAESYAIEVEIEQRVNEVPEAVRRLDRALEPYLEMRRDVGVLLAVGEIVYGDWPEDWR